MKKVMSKNKAIIIAVMAFFSTSFSTPLSAMDKKSDPPGVEIKYLGFQNRNPVFEILTNNLKADNFLITIRDGEGTVLFSEKLSGKNLSRKYRIDTQEEITLLSKKMPRIYRAFFVFKCRRDFFIFLPSFVFLPV